MKRASAISISTLMAAIVCLSTMGFQCSSPNITSGKLYYQQYESTKNPEKLEQAMDAFQKEVAEKPNSMEGWYWIGFVHGVKKEYLKLHEAWQKSEKLGPSMKKDIDANTSYFWGQAYNNGAAAFKKAQIKNDKRLFGEAAENFKAATLLSPDSSAKYGGYVNYAFALIAQDKGKEAVDPLRMQLEMIPNADAYRVLGQITLEDANDLKKENKTPDANTKYDEAISILNEGLVKFPDDPELNQALLNAYIAAGRLAEAEPKFKLSANKNPNDKMAQYEYGTVLLETKKYEESVIYLQKALALDPKLENALYNTCVSYLRWGVQVRDTDANTNTEKQSDAFKEIIRRSIPSLQELVKLNPESAANWDLAGKLYASVGMTKEAADAYTKADTLRK